MQFDRELDKTQAFHDQIHAKQKGTSAMDCAECETGWGRCCPSERDALAKKAQALQADSKEAGETLEALQEDMQTKVIFKFVQIVQILSEGFKTRRVEG